MSTCINTPTKDGKPIVLFETIKKFAGRDIAVKALGYAQSPDIAKHFPNGYPTDAQGYPTVEFMLSQWDWRDKINFNDGSVRLKVAELNKMARQNAGKIESIVWLDKQESWDALTEQAKKFNTESPFRFYYRAKVGKGYNSDITGIKINLDYIEKTPNKNFNLSVQNRVYNEKLNTRLRQILFNAGVSIGALNELDKRTNITGVFDADVTDKTVDGLVEMIRLADGINGEKALPEEFAHFAIEALSDNPIVQRSLNNLITNESYKDIIGEEYDEYFKLYKGNEALLAKEALGKILSDKLIQNPIPTNLFTRLINAIKSFFTGLKNDKVDFDLLDAREAINDDMNKLANNIINGKLAKELKVENVKTTYKLYQLDKKLESIKNALQGLIEVEVQRYKVYSDRNYEFDKKEKALVEDLQRNMTTNTYLEGVTNYLELAVKDAKKVQAEVTNMVSNYKENNLRETAHRLRKAKDFTDAYKASLKILDDTVNTLTLEGDLETIEPILESIKDLREIVGRVESLYDRVSAPIFIKFIEKFVPEKALINPFVKDKDGNYSKTTIDEIIRESKDDISFLSRWFNAMGQMGDASLRMFDTAIKDVQEDNRLASVAIEKRLKAAQMELESTGIKDTEWVLEKDANGVPTGNWITEIDYGKYIKAREEAQAKFREESKDSDGKVDSIEYNNLMRTWYNNNQEGYGKNKKPKYELYKNEVYANLTKGQQEYLETINSIKQELDSMIPDKFVTPNQAVMIRKDLLERVKSNPKAAIVEHFKDTLTRREQDLDEFGNEKGHVILQDFEGKEVNAIPIYYTKPLSNMQDLSGDITSTLIAYADMAINFKGMNQVVDILEIGRDVMMGTKQVVDKRGGKEQRFNIKELGESFSKVLTKKGDQSNIGNALNDYLNAQLYGRFKADQGNIGKTNLDYAKTLDSIGAAAAMNTQALSVLGGMSNVITGKIMAGVEAMAGQYINHKSLLKGDAYYGKDLLPLLGEIGNRTKVSKLALFEEMFDTLDDHAKTIRDKQMDRKTWLAQAFKTNSLFFLAQAGEHYMQNRTFLALASDYRMLDNNGKETNLYEALEVKYIDENNHSKGATLQIKEGYTKEDGTEFTKEDIKSFTRKGKEINHQLHGIYNKADQAAIQKYAEGRMVMMFRKFLPIAITRRYAKAQYNYNLDEWTEGYYRTAGKFLWQIAKDARKLDFQNKAYWSKLNSTEKANLRRAATEGITFLLTTLAASLIDWDDKDSPWAKKMMEYQFLRLRADLALMTPTPFTFTEGLQLLESPAASISYLQKVTGILSLDAFDTIEQGRYKGHMEITKDMLQLLPVYRNIEGIMDPSLRSTFFR